MPNILAFRILGVSSFLVFDVSNVKYLAFDTPDGMLRALSPALS